MDECRSHGDCMLRCRCVGWHTDEMDECGLRVVFERWRIFSWMDVVGVVIV